MSSFILYIITVLSLIIFVLIIEMSMKYLMMTYYLFKITNKYHIKFIVMIESVVNQEYFKQKNEGWISDKSVRIFNESEDILEVVKGLYFEIKKGELN